MLAIVEFIGTFLFLSTILTYAGKNAHAAGIIGVALAATVYWGNGHYNPAVTLMYVLGGDSDGATMRIIGQIAGALAAYYWPRLL